MNILNLGAGNRIVKFAVNHDRTLHNPAIDIAWDLNNLPWPWAGNAFDKIVAWAVLEHLDIDLLTSINECWRIVKPDGELSIKLPRWDCEASYNDLTHRWLVGPRIFDQLDPTTQRGHDYDFYTPRKWRIIETGIVADSIYGTLRAIKD